VPWTVGLADTDLDTLPPLRNLQGEYLNGVGFLNLRCHWFQGCPLAYNISTTITQLDDPNTVLETFEEHYAGIFHAFFPDEPIPTQVAATCCSQFAVTASAIRRHPKQKYEQIRNWLIDTQMEDYMSGRVLEYMWHVIFGKEPVHCPSARECYCRGFGKCDLKCTEGDCGVYQYPLNIPRLKTLWWKIKWAWG
jgi:hypothetical protein